MCAIDLFVRNKNRNVIYWQSMENEDLTPNIHRIIAFPIERLTPQKNFHIKFAMSKRHQVSVSYQFSEFTTTALYILVRGTIG